MINNIGLADRNASAVPRPLTTVMILDIIPAIGEIAATTSKIVVMIFSVSGDIPDINMSSSEIIVVSCSMTGINTSASCPATFPKLAVAVAFVLSIESLNSFAPSSASCERIRPASSASSPSSFKASAPPKINGFKSCADLPKICIAYASLCVSSSMPANALIASLNTS